ncbi:hypothetical protein LCGC14_2457200, partial [marine sediment metagenome]
MTDAKPMTHTPELWKRRGEWILLESADEHATAYDRTCIAHVAQPYNPEDQAAKNGRLICAAV